MGDLIEAKGSQPLVDRSYPLEQLADAHAYVRKGVKRRCFHHHLKYKDDNFHYRFIDHGRCDRYCRMFFLERWI